ncbi:Stk1 family PASTA domain-containing Ser/Thr kinase [Streptomyces sp. SID13726]|uniref:Stk1 family PASTA domain-containing Ser/Thr kinase n=1 Tax=Streptomyces sp. SID13726 TaxID=2706058 RepID=UPI0013B6BE7C|nr:Stk1 family PASTA domain-containing Ser/Thr kinase [Streptomyces sp. SID13726]
MTFGGPDDLTFARPAPVVLLGGRYELRLLLGSGGMAEVHLAHDLRLDRAVAVKMLRGDLAHDPGLQERFRREAQSTASLNHPAVAAVYDTGEHLAYGAQFPYLVMEYVDGATLRDTLYSGPPLTLQRALEMTCGVLDALAHSHRQGIVHRDIKPANVMLTRTGQVKVMDFGIARDTRDVGMTGTSLVIGTAPYLSPEQALGQDIDSRSDLYSVGCLLYELLTFRTPFTGDNPMEVMYRHLYEEPLAPSLYNPEVAPRVDAVVLRALTKDRAYRYRSAEEMRADIDACLGTRTVGVQAADGAAEPFGDVSGNGPEDSAAGGVGDDKRRRRGNAALIAASVGVAVLAVTLGWFMFGRDTAEDGKVDVPALVGKTLTEARSSAENVDLTLTVTKQEPCADQPRDHICTQAPVDGRLDKGEAVSVTVSTGAPEVEVPDVTDKDEDDASRILEDKSFKVKVRHEVSTRDAGTVLDQDPAGGETVEKGIEITLTVAEEAEQAMVPDLTGSTVSRARELLDAQGLKLGETTRVESGAEAGTVVGQSVGQGEKVDRGTSIDVRVAESVETVQIPADLVGSTLAEARGELNGLGLEVAVASGSSQTSDAVVTSSNPQAGSEVAAGSTVVLTTEEPTDEPTDSTTQDAGSATTPSDTGAR